MAHMKMKRSTFLGMSLRAYTTISCLLILCLAMLLLHSGDSAASAQVAQKPNIVFILTDDSDYHLLSKMPNIRTELIQKGVTFTNASSRSQLAVRAALPSCAASTLTTTVSST